MSSPCPDQKAEQGEKTLVAMLSWPEWPWTANESPQGDPEKGTVVPAEAVLSDLSLIQVPYKKWLAPLWCPEIWVVL